MGFEALEGGKDQITKNLIGPKEESGFSSTVFVIYIYSDSHQ